MGGTLNLQPPLRGLNVECFRVESLGVKTQSLRGFLLHITWGIAKIMVPFWVPIIIRGLIRGLI